MASSSPAKASGVFAQLKDGLVNLVNSLGTSKDPRTATTYSFVPLDYAQLIMAYRSNWLARRIVDAVAEDATREWREWQADGPQIQAIEDEEKKHGVQLKTQQALVRARLYGGSAIIMGIDGAGGVSEPLGLDMVQEGSLKFLVVLSSKEITRGQLIADVESPWFGRGSYYRVNTGRADLSKLDVSSLTDIHPSRVIEFVGADIPDWDLINGTNAWGDSVLQIVDDVLKDYGMSVASIAAMINDAKVDVFTIPGLTKSIADPDYENRLKKRLIVSNQMKSTINAMLMDEKEKWERTQTTWSGLPDIMEELLKIVAGASKIPMTRLIGHASGSGSSAMSAGKASGGMTDMRTYYDDVMSDQKNDYGPRLAPLDEVIKRSAGVTDDQVYYEWTPLYQPDPSELAAIAVQKATVFAEDVSTGLINPDVLRDIRINQLVEDGFYPGLEAAVDKHGAEPEEPKVTPEDVQAHLGMLQKSSKQLQQIGQQAQPLALPKPGQQQQTKDDGSALADLSMFRRRA